MKRVIASAAVIVWMTAQVLPAQQNAQSQAQPPNGAPTKPAPKLGNPLTVVQQLMRMTPEERERALEKLPPQRQELIRERLEKFDSLPKAEQERRLRLAEIFANLPPDKQDLVRRQIRAFNQLPDDRRRMVGAAFQRLRRMPEAQRQARLNSEGFRNRFTPAEQQMITDLSEDLPPPGLDPPRP
jgi:hypothetical protein